MNEIGMLLLWNTLLATGLAVVMAGAGCFRFMRDRPALRHKLWLLVLFKLVTPPLIPLPVLPAIGSPNGGDLVMESTAPAALEETTNRSNKRGHTSDKAAHRPAHAVVSSSSTQPGRHVEASGRSVEAGRVSTADARSDSAGGKPLGLTWNVAAAAGLLSIGMTLVFVIRAICQLRKVSPLLRRAGDDGERFKRIAELAARRMGVQQAPRVCVVNARVTPLLWVRWNRPLIVLPRRLVEQITDEQILCIACHELAHYKRGDHWSNAFAFGVGAVLWWHPVVWWARRELRVAQEICCDGLVVGSSRDGARRYAETLFQVLDFVRTERSRLPQLASGFGAERSIKRRFEMIATQSARYQLSWFGYAALLVLLVATCCFPAYAQTGKPKSATSASRPDSPDGLTVILRFADADGDGDLDVLVEEAPPSSANGESVPHPPAKNVSSTTAAADLRSAPPPTPAYQSAGAASRVSARAKKQRADQRRVAVSPDGLLIAVLETGQKSGEIDIFSASSGKLLEPTTLKGRVTSIAFSPDGNNLLAIRDVAEEMSYDVRAIRRKERVKTRVETPRKPVGRVREGDWAPVSDARGRMQLDRLKSTSALPDDESAPGDAAAPNDLTVFKQADATAARPPRATARSLSEATAPKTKSSATPDAPRPYAVIQILADGRIELEQTAVTLQELREQLVSRRAATPRLQASIRCDRDLPYQRVGDVLAVCREVGVSDIKFSIQPAGTALSSRTNKPVQLIHDSTVPFDPTIVERAIPSVVNIHGHKPTGTGNLVTAHGVVTVGAGVVVDRRGYIITNHHAIRDLARLEVSLSDGRQLAGRLVAYDARRDLALLKIDVDKPLPVIPSGTPHAATVGDAVLAIGNAHGYEPTVTRGVINALDRTVHIDEERQFKRLIQTDAAIHAGNSGGPLLNHQGELIGINLAIRIGAQGIGFAIPAEEALTIAKRLIEADGQRE